MNNDILKKNQQTMKNEDFNQIKIQNKNNQSEIKLIKNNFVFLP